MDLLEIERVALGAAHGACRVQRRYFEGTFEIRKKGGIDLVTQADIESEKAIIEVIRGAFPDHGILAEESGAVESASPYSWCIDPLDGTTNFAHGVPLFAVSIAFAQHGETVFGLVANPVSGELFSAARGRGARKNGKPISVSTTKDLHDSLLVTGFPYDLGQMMGQLMERFASCLAAARGVRRLGSAALDLCFVACGRFDGFWEQNLHPWDTAAGALILEEAGGRVTDFSLGKFSPDQKEILATNGKIHDALAKLVRP